ncbi:MAG: hypothetical protein WBQ04_14260 [Candidatus Acidiferrales bacterium]
MRSGLQEVEFDYRLNDRSRARVVDDRRAGAFRCDSTVNSAAKGRQQQDSVIDGPSNQKRTETAERAKSKDALIAFDDKELSAWVMRLGEERSGRFLCALAEAVMKADADDYSLIRPALLDLKRKHRHGGPRPERVVSSIARKKESNHDSPPQSRGQ